MRSGKQPAGAAGEASHTDPLKIIMRKKKMKMKEKENRGKKEEKASLSKKTEKQKKAFI